MAYLQITGVSYTSLNWYIGGLGSYWNTANYSQAVISSGTTSEGSTYAPSGVLGSVYPPSSGGSYSTSTGYLSSGLSAGNTYYFYGYVKAANGRWYSAGSATVRTPSLTTSAPSYFSMSGSSATEIYMNWSSVSGASQYEVAIYSPISSSRTTSSTYVYWGGLSPNTWYYGYVRAYSSSGGWSSWSSYGSARTLTPVLRAPSYLNMSGSSSTELHMNWGSVSEATSYDVAIYSPISSSRTAYSTTIYWGNLSTNTMHYGYVKAYSSSYGIYSDLTYSSGRTLAATSAPLNFTMSATSTSEIYMHWSSVSGATQYEIAIYSPISSSRTTSSTYVYWGNLTANTWHYAYVRAYSSSGGWSSWSVATSAKTLAPQTTAPTNFSMSATSSTEIYMSWSSVSGATSYEVAIYSPISSSRTVTTSSTYWGSLSPNTLYYAYVRAYTANGGWSGWSTYTTARTLLQTTAPTGFTITTSSNTELYMSWNTVNGATLYEVAIYSPISSSRTVVTAYVYWGNLNPNTLYYGYVRAYTATGGWSDYSAYATGRTAPSRPINFTWSNVKSSGAAFNLTAAEWNALCTRINEFRAYKSLSTYSFTHASQRSVFYATQYNEVVNAIGAMSPSTSVPSTRTKGNTIYASDLNKLRDSLNSIT